MSDKPKNVFRIDIEPTEENPDRHPTHGWQVRVKRQKEQHTKYFSDKRFGGREEALEKAVEYRDEPGPGAAASSKSTISCPMNFVTQTQYGN